jgi:D-arabinose 5-phosphate isomerase GutQ
VANDDGATDSVPAFKESLQLDAECANVISGLLETTEVEKFVNTLESCTGRVLVSGVGKLRFASSSFILNSSISSKFFLEVQ